MLPHAIVEAGHTNFEIDIHRTDGYWHLQQEKSKEKHHWNICGELKCSVVVLETVLGPYLVLMTIVIMKYNAQRNEKYIVYIRKYIAMELCNLFLYIQKS